MWCVPRERRLWDKNKTLTLCDLQYILYFTYSSTLYVSFWKITGLQLVKGYEPIKPLECNNMLSNDCANLVSLFTLPYWNRSVVSTVQIVTWVDAGETKQVRGVKHLIKNGQGTRQEQRQHTRKQRQKTIHAAVGNRAGKLTNIGEEINKWWVSPGESNNADVRDEGRQVCVMDDWSAWCRAAWHPQVPGGEEREQMWHKLMSKH